MTYFGFLLRFLVIPIAILAAVACFDGRRGRAIPLSLRAWPIWAAILLHVVVAVIYTTPWDNYLVATGVWYYDPARVAGITFGWVPIEEYGFFVVQTILAGLWMLFLMRRLSLSRPEPGMGQFPAPRQSSHSCGETASDHAAIASTRGLRWRTIPVLLLGALWAVSLAILVSGWAPGTYFGLELVWALPPIMLQIAFGGDILRRYGRLVLLSIVSLVLYLSATDFLAIGSGIWAINPAKSLAVLVGGVLPVEEVLFFLLTNMLIVFGVVLIISQASHARIRGLRQTRCGARVGQIWQRDSARRGPSGDHTGIAPTLRADDEDSGLLSS